MGATWKERRVKKKKQFNNNTTSLCFFSVDVFSLFVIFFLLFCCCCCYCWAASLQLHLKRTRTRGRRMKRKEEEQQHSPRRIECASCVVFAFGNFPLLCKSVLFQSQENRKKKRRRRNFPAAKHPSCDFLVGSISGCFHCFWFNICTCGPFDSFGSVVVVVVVVVVVAPLLFVFRCLCLLLSPRFTF